MDEERVRKLIKTVDDMSEKYTNEEFIIAVYLLIRFGKSTIDNYIDGSDFEEIKKEIKSHKSIFDEELNYNIDKILNAEE